MLISAIRFRVPSDIKRAVSVMKLSAVAPPVTAEWVRLDPPGAGPHDDPRHPPAGVVPFLHKPVELLTPG